jgi:hypothetical protein
MQISDIMLLFIYSAKRFSFMRKFIYEYHIYIFMRLRDVSLQIGLFSILLLMMLAIPSLIYIQGEKSDAVPVAAPYYYCPYGFVYDQYGNQLYDYNGVPICA